MSKEVMNKQDIEQSFRDEVQKNVEYICKFHKLEGNKNDMHLLGTILMTYRDKQDIVKPYGIGLTEWIQKK